MGEPVTTNVLALDPVLEAGATTALSVHPDIAVLTRAEPAWVSVVIVDGVGSEVLDLVRATRNAAHRPEVVLVAAALTPGEALHAILAGARGLVRRRDANADRLARAVLGAAEGDSTVPPGMLDRLLEYGAGTPPAAEVAELTSGLSQREREVLRLVADGHETSEIAVLLCYSARTVTGLVHDIMHRFRLRNRAHAVAFAMRAGLL